MGSTPFWRTKRNAVQHGKTRTNRKWKVRVFSFNQARIKPLGRYAGSPLGVESNLKSGMAAAFL
jgi:hypothetical protein